MTILTLTAAQAIARSISHDETVTIDGDNQAHLDLLAESDKHVDCGRDQDGVSHVEYWGKTDTGDTWRVHVSGKETDCGAPGTRRSD